MLPAKKVQKPHSTKELSVLIEQTIERISRSKQLQQALKNVMENSPTSQPMSQMQL